MKVGTQGAVFVAQEEHTNHDDKPEKNSLSEVLDKIKELEEFGLKPRGINAELAKSQ